MLAIYKKELRSYFTSVIACIFIAATALISGIFFVYYNLSNGYTQMYSAYECLFIFVFTCPVLTMKVISDERKQKTDQLLLTAPITVGKVVVGKFLALLTIFAIPIALMCLQPPIMASFGVISFKTAYTCILGLFLYGMVFVAIGMFISSITESQVIAVIISIVVLLLGYLMSSLTGMISTDGNILTQILSWFDLYTPAMNFMNGAIRLCDVVYYITLTLVFVFLTMQSIQKRRWNVSKRMIGTGIFSAAYIVVVIAAAVVVNLVFGIVTNNMSWATVDATESSIYSITDETKDMLKNLDEDVTVYVMSSKNDADSYIKRTLSRYSSESGHIKVEYKDTTKYPTFYQEYTDTAPTEGSLIVVDEETGKSKVIDYYDIYVSDYSSYYTTGSYTTDYDCEGQIDSALTYVRSEDMYTIYQIEGHDEAINDSNNFGTSETLTDIIEKYNCGIETVTLATMNEISVDDCAALLIIGPEKDYTEEDAKKVKDYLNAGGKAIIAVENMASLGVDKPNFYSILEDFNISVEDGVIAENNTSYYYASGGPWYVLTEGITGYASDLSSYVFTPYTVGFSQLDEENEDVTYTALASTSSNSVLKTDPSSATSYEKEKGDVDGPFDVVVTASKEISSGDDDDLDTVTAEILVFGSAYALSDTMDSIVSQSNTQIVNNALDSYIDTSIQTVSIPAKSLTPSTLTVTESGSRWFGILIAIVLPIAVLVAGIAVWASRRKK